MSSPYCYEHPRPSVTVDIVAFAREEAKLRVLLIRRKHEPFAGRWALPGGFLNLDEPLEVAARRELLEETGLVIPGALRLVGIFGEPGRDPRGRTLSVAFGAVASHSIPSVEGGDDAKTAKWASPYKPRQYAFDHAQVMQAGLQWLWREFEAGPAGLDLLPEEFGESDMRELLEALKAPPQHHVGWLEKMLRARLLQPLPGASRRFRKLSLAASEP